MTKTQCARCHNHLSERNSGPDKLCGYCQRELAPHHNGAAYREWVAGGRQRVLDRNRRPVVNSHVNGHARVQAALLFDVRAVPTPTLLEELRRRKNEALELIRLLPQELTQNAG